MDGNKNIQSYLSQHYIIETRQETEKRARALQQLRDLIPELITRITQNTLTKRDNFECQLQSFGSYGLGGYITGADIDLVFLAAAPVRRNQFFTIFPQLLRRAPRVSNVEVIRRTAVPIIKFILDEFSVDISFANLKANTIPAGINLLDDNLLHGLDSVCIASLDGPRTQQFIMNSVRRHHVSAFQIALQVIKYWANQRCLYGKQIGYLNGSTWTFLLLKTYLLANQDALINAESLISSFFRTWSKWDWRHPVMLTNTIPTLGDESPDYQSMTDFQDAYMPIVSPCYPVCSAAPFVTKSTRQVIVQELQRANDIIEYALGDTALMLDLLFQKMVLFKRYHHFLQITITAETFKSKETWIRKMACNIPMLLQMLESNPQLSQIHPYTKVYSHQFHYRTDQGRMALEDGIFEPENDYAVGTLQPGSLHVVCYFIGLKPNVQQQGYPVIDLFQPVDDFLAELEGKRNDKDNDVTFAVKAIKRKEVPDWIRTYDQ
ncbi:Nucleotidyltransferase [Lichtheimia hyalospora FSU 10163]|nr:Nucleotidyltransferase [Lichtheimia hyalospora FSU 10163]